MENIEKLITEYETKYEEGFTDDEIKNILENYPNINMDKFNGAMMGNTCAMRDGLLVMYPCDVRAALYCGMENRDLNIQEWD